MRKTFDAKMTLCLLDIAKVNDLPVLLLMETISKLIADEKKNKDK